MTKGEKISASLKKHFADHGHHNTNRKGPKKTDAQKAILSKKAIAAYDRIGRLTDREKKARNVANVTAYRAKQKNAITSTSDIKLIRRIYECCPVGFHVDHIVALGAKGPHHQDNLQYLPASENCRKGKTTLYDSSLAIKWQDVISNPK
jgi:hypothetical protein